MPHTVILRKWYYVIVLSSLFSVCPLSISRALVFLSWLPSLLLSVRMCCLAQTNLPPNPATFTSSDLLCLWSVSVSDDISFRSSLHHNIFFLRKKINSTPQFREWTGSRQSEQEREEEGEIPQGSDYNGL